MQSTIQYIESELAEVYPQSEIRALLRIILEAVCGMSYTEQVLRKNEVLSGAHRKSIHSIVSRLKAHEPIQYILGETEFCGLQVKVNPSVLIPRPETEELVNFVMEKPIAAGAKIMDIGTGSGCIALALKSALPETVVCALDISPEALETAAENARMNHLELSFLQADILQWESREWEKYDVIVSNPPYVRNSEKQSMENNVLKFEPAGALFVRDDDPLVFYRQIAAFAQKYLNDKGRLFFEINEYLGAEMCALLKQLGFRDIDLRKDINHRDRMIACRK